MNKHNGLKFIMIILGITVIPILFNLYSFIFGTISNVQGIASLLCLLGWFLLSLYSGKDKTYSRFIFIYWGIEVILYIVLLLANTYGSKNLVGIVTLFPPLVWLYVPFYGFRLFFKELKFVIPLIKLITYISGYLLGVMVRRATQK